MPLLLNVLEAANGPDYGKLRLKAMECAGLIGTADIDIRGESVALSGFLKPLLSVVISSVLMQMLSLSCLFEYKVSILHMPLSSSIIRTSFR